MAGCQERSCLFFLTVSFILFGCLAAKGYTPVLKDFPTTVFQRHLKVSRHHPVCIVFRKIGGVGSKLEKTVFDLWQNKRVPSNYTSWEFGAFDLQKDKLPPKAAQPKKLPSMRCYLGETSVYSYQGKADKARVGQWLYELTLLHIEQSIEVTPELLKNVQKKFKIVLIAFPDGPRHHEVEDMVYKLASDLESCKALAVHLNSAHVKALREKYGFSKYPSVVVIHNKVIKRKKGKQVIEDYRVFSNVEVNQHVLEVYILAHSVQAPFLALGDFRDKLKKNVSNTSQFRPLLVCFYAYWAKDVKGYLYAFNSTVVQYRADRMKLRYGLVDLTAAGSNEVIREYTKMGAMNQVPFLVLYYKDNNGDITSTHLHTDRPYPWVLYNHMEKVQDNIVTLTGVRSYEPPWGTITFDQFSSLKEGPNGSLCTPWSSNLTDNTPFIPKPVVKKVRVFVNRTTVAPKPKPSWHDKFDTDSIERQLSAHNGIPLLTQETWSKVVEKSHAPRHIFYKSGKWAGEVTKVSLVVFIMAECGNCKRNNQTFKDIQRSVSHVDGGAMYYVNCTAEKELCATHNIRGFPIISAFRGLGWMDVSNTSCLSMRSKSTFKRFVRLDYHGVIKADYIMDWFSTIADNAVINMKMDPVPIVFERKDIKIVSTLVPVPSRSATLSVYSYKCLRLLCERLYSLMDCYTQYTESVSEMEYDKTDVDLTVTKLVFHRSDGVSAILMRSGLSLYDTLEDMSDTELHALHTSHSYGIKEGQTCEEDPASCTDILIEFILEHSKLPVTPITSDLFHTVSSSMKEDDLPILIALAHAANISASSSFLKNLTKVAYQFYNSMTVMTLNVDIYSVWATKFVPKLYGHQRVWNSDSLDPLLMYVYPRLCIVKKSDHNHAAFYPPTDRQPDIFYSENIIEFVNAYFDSPESVVVETEEF